jgi:hypothetical protein
VLVPGPQDLPHTAASAVKSPRGNSVPEYRRGDGDEP